MMSCLSSQITFFGILEDTRSQNKLNNVLCVSISCIIYIFEFLFCFLLFSLEVYFFRSKLCNRFIDKLIIEMERKLTRAHSDFIIHHILSFPQTTLLKKWQIAISHLASKG